MPSFAVEVHPLAADEAETAERWYRERSMTAVLGVELVGSALGQKVI